MASQRESAAEQDQRGSTLAEKIDALFRVVRRPDHEPYSHEEVARACREASGESFSATYLWQLRTGRRDNPTKRHLEALAGFFQVPVAYFFDDDQGAAIARELELLGALRDAGVRSVALRAVNLSPEGVSTISDIIDVLARREQGTAGHGKQS
ncbi:XRE family transcriptional regulator [Streptomyces camelliae]|uniref:XRE family transcriptional regulator n=1 Tax=Streptomyces camelliae TaxID=3004093 RepID=A0ABY7PE78_9ACTN|nr:XRE family transcriptional regulator [Streptomyces sp. HUAS 2-6]WBO68677.1 XRE family transcriptional regulator [Streptomyces sp. HUAS 2-6]